MSHIPVLLNETITALNLKPDSVVVDATLGGAGHAKAILQHLGDEGVYVGIDADKVAISEAEALKQSRATVHLVNDNFTNIGVIVRELKLQPTAIMADLGWRSDQFETGGKGFSFQSDEPLLMTYGEPEKYHFTASDIVNAWEESSIADIIYGYGEERRARRIAKAIVEARQTKPIRTAKELAEIVAVAVSHHTRYSRIHPATKTFQALRIAVNNELESLKKLLEDGFTCLVPEGRMAVISFHSLEDRIVKTFFKNLIGEGFALRQTKKPQIASDEELQNNPRARSAKLRVIEKTFTE